MYVPERLVLQWHITERCNMRCAHCYQDEVPSPNPTWEQLVHILDQYKKILSYWHAISGNRVQGHINITGGEPFLRRDFFDLLALFNREKQYFSYAILSNGLFCTPQVGKRLRELNPKFVQISLDGGPAVHDGLRGRGGFTGATAALRCLKDYSISTLVAFTAGAENFRDFPAVMGAARAVGADAVWADRLIPLGSRGATGRSLSPKECEEFFALMSALKKEKKWWRLGEPELRMNRALQFLHGGGEPYRCRAGDTLLAVLPNGDLLPCRRMPIVVGNLFHTDLLSLYYDSNLLFLLREEGRVARGCEECIHSSRCRGGLRCLAYALHGDPFLADPGCGLAST